MGLMRCHPCCGPMKSSVPPRRRDRVNLGRHSTMGFYQPPGIQIGHRRQVNLSRVLRAFNPVATAHRF